MKPGAATRCIALAAMVICASAEARAEPACYAKDWQDCIDHVARLEHQDAEREKRGHPTLGKGLREKWENECLDDKNASSCVLAAIARTRGFGGPADADKAKGSLWLACEFDADAVDLVVHALRVADGVPVDSEAASAIEAKFDPPEPDFDQVDWDQLEVSEYEADCNEGKVKACVKAAVMNDQGEGVVSDPSRAYDLFWIACDRDRSLCIDIAYAYEKGTKIGKDKQYAKQFRKLALRREGEKGCRYGSTDKCVTSGHAFMKGKVVERDREYAVVLFEEACRAGDADGCESLAEAYWTNPTKNKGRAEAVELYRKACDAKSGAACWKLARLYLRGEKVKQNTKRGEKLIERSCKLGFSDGCEYLEKRP